MEDKKEETKEIETGGFTEAPPPRRLTAMDIQQKEFRIARFRGYKERDVDEFLDELTVSVQALADENERLRAQSGSSTSAIGAPDLAHVSRQADEIIERARRESARIIREAEARAAVGGAPPSASRDDVAAVSAFLRKEREFLQGMAMFVQEHAEGLKSMARDTFARPAQPAGAPEPAGPPTGKAPTKTEESPPETETPVKVKDAPLTVEEAEEPIRVVEPAPASVGVNDEESEEGDRSLRDLFWGEE
jgi:DivIVA domain-containing protein